MRPCSQRGASDGGEIFELPAVIAATTLAAGSNTRWHVFGITSVALGNWGPTRRDGTTFTPWIHSAMMSHLADFHDAGDRNHKAILPAARPLDLRGG